MKGSLEGLINLLGTLMPTVPLPPFPPAAIAQSDGKVCLVLGGGRGVFWCSGVVLDLGVRAWSGLWDSLGVLDEMWGRLVTGPLGLCAWGVVQDWYIRRAWRGV